MYVLFFFFFKQKTAYEIVDCDWSSDVCSSDLMVPIPINATFTNFLCNRRFPLLGYSPTESEQKQKISHLKNPVSTKSLSKTVDWFP